MGELKFDNMEIDTKLAETFLEENKSELDLFFDKSKTTEISLAQILTTKPTRDNDLNGKFKSLAFKIEENAELFAQLESLKRKLPKDDIKNYDIRLIVQNLKNTCLNHGNKMQDFPFFLSMEENTPLAELGFIAQKTNKRQDNNMLVIGYCDATGALCYLFARLCHAVGLHNICFVYKELKESASVNWRGSCTGVVTEHSDVDSAVDALLASTSSAVEYKWKLQRIYVQESVYERFKKTLSWKCNLKSSGDGGHAGSAQAIAHCSNVFIHDQKVLLCDYAGSLDKINDKRHVILVEAYRTTKELLSLAKKADPFSVSLWSNDVSESNEIAYGLKVNIVWINDYGVFDGPVRISQAFYCVPKLYSYVENTEDIENLQKISKSWFKLSTDDRLKLIKNAVEEYTVQNPSSKIAPQMCAVVTNLQSKNFVDIENGKIWVGIDEPIGFVSQDIDDMDDFVKILTSAVQGNVIVWCGKPAFEFLYKEDLGQLLHKIPAFFKLTHIMADRSDSPASLKILTSLYHQTRVVYSSFGTMFAN